MGNSKKSFRPLFKDCSNNNILDQACNRMISFRFIYSKMWESCSVMENKIKRVPCHIINTESKKYSRCMHGGVFWFVRGVLGSGHGLGGKTAYCKTSGMFASCDVLLRFVTQWTTHNEHRPIYCCMITRRTLINKTSGMFASCKVLCYTVCYTVNSAQRAARPTFEW